MLSVIYNLKIFSRSSKASTRDSFYPLLELFLKYTNIKNNNNNLYKT